MYRLWLAMLLCPLLALAAATYSYDAAGRLLKVDYGAAGSITYTYDKAGNLLSRTVAGSAATGGTITSVNTSGSPPSAGIAPNGWIEIKGTNLVPASTPAAGVSWGNSPSFAQGQLPTNVNGITVSVNGKSAYVYFFCSANPQGCNQDQVNALTPIDTTTGPVQVVVSNNGVPSAPFSVTENSLVPSFLLFSPRGYVVATHFPNLLADVGPSTLFPGLTTPVAIGDLAILYAVGFGLPSTTLTPGSSSQSATLGNPVCKVGGVTANSSAVNLVSPGLYQINLTVPSGVSSGDNALTCTYSGLSTQSGVLLTVQ